jgi:phage terminase large subunit-like protein
MTAVELEPAARVAGKYERLCWERHERDLRAAYGDRWDDPTVYGVRSLSHHPKGFWFDADAGERVTTFIESYCRHFEGEWAGLPLVLAEWQRDINRAVFGWMRADGSRRFRTVYIEIPRKNGKSTWAGGVGLYLTIADGEAGAQVYVTASKKDQAKIVWGAAAKMVKRSSKLQRFASAWKTAIACDRLGSTMAPLGANSETQDGFNAHAQLVDEMHAHKNRHVYDVVATSMGARRQPLNWIITTSGIFDPESIGWEFHERAMHVLNGVIEDDALFVFIAGADPKDDWTDPATWEKANPNLGISVKREYMAEQCARAQTTPSFLNTFKRYHLDLWTQQRDTWIPIEKWDACGRIVDVAALAGKRCCGGLDLSSNLDITALVLAFPDGEWMDFLFWFFCPEETIQKRSKEDRVPYDAWTRDGWMTPTPGNVVDYGFIEAKAIELAGVHQLAELAYDPWNATQAATNLGEKGLTMVEFRQGYGSLSEPSKHFESLVTAGRVGHRTTKGANPVMRWMIANAAVRHDPADNIKPDKSATKGRIDGVVAAVMATGRASVTRDESSVYNSQDGIFFL